MGGGGTVSVGVYGCACAGHRGIAEVGKGGYAKAGVGGVLRFDVGLAYTKPIECLVGVDGIKPDTFYFLGDFDEPFEVGGG